MNGAIANILIGVSGGGVIALITLFIRITVIRFDRLEDRFDRLEDRFDRLEDKVDGVTTDVHALDTKFTTEIHALDTKFTTEIHALDTNLTTEIHALDTNPHHRVQGPRRAPGPHRDQARDRPLRRGRLAFSDLLRRRGPCWRSGCGV